MSLVSNLQSAFTRVGTEFKSVRTQAFGSATGDASGLSTTSKNLVGAINELAARAVSTALSALTDVSITGIAGGQFLRYDATSSKWKNVDPTTYLQPRDSDLDAIAALTTAPYGLNLLTLTNQAGLYSALGVSTDGTLAGNSDTAIPTQKAVKTAIAAGFDANDALQYKGVIDASTNPTYPAANAGWVYKISVAGKIGGAAGVNVEVGDTLYCTVDGSAAGTQASVGANWNIVQTNIDGAVTGPTSSTAGDFASFNGTTGKVVADSGFAPDTSTTMTSNSATAIPTTQGVRGFTYDKSTIGDPTTDFVAGFVAALS